MEDVQETRNVKGSLLLHVSRRLRFRRYNNMKKRKNEIGFTLLELLVSIAIIAVIGIALASILASSLRDANKANTVTAVRQNGDYALLQMTKSIRDAASITYPVLPCSSGTPLDHVSVTALDNTPITYTCTSGSPANITGPSGALIDTNVAKVSSCNFYCSQADSSQNPVIKIDFQLTGNSSSGLVEQQASLIDFQTSVVMRNIGR